jgi:hypothetical protein
LRLCHFVPETLDYSEGHVNYVVLSAVE